MSLKKRKTENGGATGKKIRADRSDLYEEIEYTPFTLEEIYSKIEALFPRIPPVPEKGFSQNPKAQKAADPSLPPLRAPTPYSKKELIQWATDIKIVIDELQLLIALISPAVYKWGTDRSGAQDQNHTVLWGELVRSQEHLMHRVFPALDSMLAPNEGLRVARSVKTKDSKTETEQMYYIKTNEDPDFTEWSFSRFALRVPLLRQVTLANMDKILKSIHDYMEAQQKDSQHDARGSFY